MSELIKVLGLRFEQHHDGFGIDCGKPRISWRFAWRDECNSTDWHQQAYDIEIDHDIYHERSSDSILRPWPGESLVSGQIAVVRVRCYGAGAAEHCLGTPTNWSDPFTVEAGLLERKDWRGLCITTSKSHLSTDGFLAPLCMRKVFKVPFPRVDRARIYVACHGVYEVKLNGHVVGNHCMAPGWTSYKHRMHYQTFDVAPLLLADVDNVLAFEIGAGWFASALGWKGGRRFRYGHRLALITQLELKFEDQVTLICSDESWRYETSAIISSDIYKGEVLDMKKRDLLNGWDSSPDFDDRTWLTVQTTDFPAAQLVSPDSAPVRTTQRVSPICAFKTASGKVIVDFGQNLVGRLRVSTIQKKPGSTVRFRHAEVMEHDELGTRPLREAECTDLILFSESELSNWSPKFTFHGFRYVQVDGWTDDESELLTPGLLTAEVMHTDLNRTGWFSCSHPKVNKLYENAVWSMRGNFLSLPTDCPQRDERLGWTGDIQIFASSAAFLYDVTGMLGHWLEDLAVEQSEPGRHGVPPLVVPSVIEKESADDDFWPVVPQAIWGDATVLVPWDLYMASGDIDILQRQYESMRSWLTDGITRGNDGLWDEDVWQLGDWLDPSAPPDDPGDGRTDSTLVADAYLVYTSGIFSEVQSVLNLPSAQQTRDQALDLKKRFGEKYITSTGLMVSDSQTAYALAIAFNLFVDESRYATGAARLSKLVRKSQFKVTTGFAGTPLICHALTAASHPQLAYRMLLNLDRPSWMYPVTIGATTMWERWDSMLPDGSINPGEMTSFNHYALGSVISWLHKSVGGISPALPGWKRINVQPIPGGNITNADVCFESPYGTIKCNWSVRDEVFRLFLEVPPNCTAVLVLPSSAPIQDERAGTAGQEIGPGRHHFQCPYQSPEWPPQAIRPPFWDQTQPRHV